MISGLLRLILSLAYWIVIAASWVLLAYVVLSLILPQNKYTLLIGKYVEPLLSPVRAWLQKTFPKLSTTGFDFSSVALWVLIRVAAWLITLLRGII